jgi:hypothetical protein
MAAGAFADDSLIGLAQLYPQTAVKRARLLIPNTGGRGVYATLGRSSPLLAHVRSRERGPGVRVPPYCSHGWWAGDVLRTY